jgi:catechol 2,3-dioxygenase-like lactoylglutathione lyase family enzyme
MREVFGGARVVTFVTKDLARARAFYVESLGFAVVDEVEGRSVTVNLGTFRLCIERNDDARRARGGGAKLTFRVKDVSRTARELDARGVGYESFTGARGSDYLETSDPDGYRLVFTERP